jgi:conjugal transfer/entry exclusion protein
MRKQTLSMQALISNNKKEILLDEKELERIEKQIDEKHMKELEKSR